MGRTMVLTIYSHGTDPPPGYYPGANLGLGGFGYGRHDDCGCTDRRDFADFRTAVQASSANTYGSGSGNGNQLMDLLQQINIGRPVAPVAAKAL